MKIARQLFLATFAAVVLATGIITVTTADPGGRTWGRGYFTNSGPMSSGFNQVIAGGITSTSSKTVFINEIRSHLNGTGGGSADTVRRNKTGAEFIVQLMRGSPYDHNRPTSADIADWIDRVNDPAVSISPEYYSYDWNSGYMGTAQNDDAFYPHSDRRYSLVFRVGGRVVFAIKQDCGNPVGDLSGLPRTPRTPQPPDPPITSPPLPPTTRSAGCKPMQVNVSPGRDIFGSPIPINVSTSEHNYGNVSSNRRIDITDRHTTGNVYTVQFRETRAWVSSLQPVRDSRGAIVGYRSVLTAPRTWTSTIGPCYDYRLTPEVDVSGSVIESGGDTTVTSSLTNAGPTTTGPTTNWRLTRVVYRAGSSPSSADLVARTDNAIPCSSFPSSGRIECTTVEDRTQSFAVGTVTSLHPYTVSSTLPVGSQVCFTVGVSRPTEDPTPSWSHSELECIIVGKKPKLQILGGDIHVGGDVSTSLSTVQTNSGRQTFGSWVEYGALIIGNTSGFASGAGLKGGAGSVAAAWNKLTFANVNDSNAASLGQFGALPANTAFIEQFTSLSGSAWSGGSITSLDSGVYRGGNMTIGGGMVAGDAASRGKTIIIISTGSVTIAGNITYKSPAGSDVFTSINQIPQVVIVARNINIEGSVRRIDAWLQTTGTTGSINTCSDVPVSANLTVGNCADTLQMNGPISTAHLHLRRTAGAENAERAGNPAEIINLRADAYLWAQRWGAESGKALTVYTNELPPRF